MTYPTRIKIAVCISLCLASTVAGCKSWGKKNFDLKSGLNAISFQSDENADAAPIEKPFKMIAIWKDATLDTQTKGVRGFAGRVYFFNREDDPVRVDGDIIVYGFDDTDEYDSRETADKKFITKADDLPAKHSVSKVGSSYSIWLPWDEIGGYRKSISLVPMFRGRDGTVVRAEPTKNHLPGNKPEKVVEQEQFMRQFRKSVRHGVAPASYVTGSETDADEDNVKRMKTTTIMIPQSMSDRLKVGQQSVRSGDVLPDGTRIQEVGSAFQPKRLAPPPIDGTANKIASESDIAKTDPGELVKPISATAENSSSGKAGETGGKPAASQRFNHIPLTPIGGNRR